MDAKGARALVERLAREGRVYTDSAAEDAEPSEVALTEAAGDSEPSLPSAERAA